MLFNHVITLLLGAILPFAFAGIALGNQNDGLQQIPIGEEEVETLTFTFTTTRTRFEFEFYTKTMTRENPQTATAQPTSTGPGHDQEAQMQYRGRRTENCDETACAMCTWYYKCERGTPECFNCDTKPYCEC